MPYNKVFFVKDFAVQAQTGNEEWVRVFVKDVNLIHHPDPGCQKDADLIESITDYISSLNPRTKFLSLRPSKAGSQIAFDMYLWRDTLQHFCTLLNLAFLQIICRTNDCTNNADCTTYQKRFELADLFQEATSNISKHLFSVNNSFGEGKVTFDIVLGWTAQPTAGEETIHMNRSAFVENLYARETSKDLTIIAANGAEVKCHRLIFEAHSEVLATMVSRENGMKESISGRIELVENTENGIRHLVGYLYGKKIKTNDMTCDLAVELFKTSHKYELTELQEAIGKLLLKKGQDWFRPDDLLELYFHLKNLSGFAKLQEYVLSLMVSSNSEIRSSERFKEIEKADINAAYELLGKLLDTAVRKGI